MLLEADPDTYSKPAYMPTWLSIRLGRGRRLGPCRRPHRGELELAAPKRLLEAGGR